VVVAFSLLTLAPSGAQSSSEKPKATDVGITANEIHIAVLADVDTSFSPGLFQGAVDGAKGAARYLNSKAGGGGVAGRKVVVDFIDTNMNPTSRATRSSPRVRTTSPWSGVRWCSSPTSRTR